MAHVVIIGAGPAGYEAALVAAQLAAETTLVEAEGPGGGCVLHDCVPSKTFVTCAESVAALREPERLRLAEAPWEGQRPGDKTQREPRAEVRETTRPGGVPVDAAAVRARVRGLAAAQSADIGRKLAAAGVRLVAGTARLGSDTLGHRHRVIVTPADGDSGYAIDASVVLIATGATPRLPPGVVPDGERILTWRQVYDLPTIPERLIIIGSGVTGAEFASAYLAMGSQVTVISSRDRMMPHEDPDAARLIERIFRERGMVVLNHSRARTVRRTAAGVVVELADDRVVEGSHALLAIGAVPCTAGLGLEEYGVDVAPSGHVVVDGVSRTSVPGIYAAGDCTGVLALASVAAMQGRIAMWHALGEAVSPLRLRTVAANVFTSPELAAVGVSQAEVDSGAANARVVTLPLAGNARAKMAGVRDGFVKLFCRPSSGRIVGGVVVAPRASELILPVTMAVAHRLTVDQLAHTITIYPSLTGSLTEAARQLMRPDQE